MFTLTSRESYILYKYILYIYTDTYIYLFGDQLLHFGNKNSVAARDPTYCSRVLDEEKKKRNCNACNRNLLLVVVLRPISSGRWIPENPRRFYAIAGSTYVYFPSWGSIQMELVDKTLPHTNFRFSGMKNDIGLFRVTILCVYNSMWKNNKATR